jgi:hypothetical protein
LLLAGKHFTFDPSDNHEQVRNEWYFRAKICPSIPWRSENLSSWVGNSPDVTENKDLILTFRAPNGRIIALPPSDVFSSPEE